MSKAQTLLKENSGAKPSLLERLPTTQTRLAARLYERVLRTHRAYVRGKDLAKALSPVYKAIADYRVDLLHIARIENQQTYIAHAMAELDDIREQHRALVASSPHVIGTEGNTSEKES